MWTCNVIYTKKKIHVIYGSFGDFGTRGCCDVRMITSIYYVLSFCPTFVRNHVIYRVASVGIPLLKDELSHSLTIS